MPPVIHVAAAAQAPLSPRSLLQRWHAHAWRPPHSAVWACQCLCHRCRCLVVRLLVCCGWSVQWVVESASVQWVAPLPPRVHAIDEALLYLQRWHWQGPQWGSCAFQCAAWHAGVQ